MQTKPAHTQEHDQIMQAVVAMANKSDLISTVILMTIGVDGRPVVAGNADPDEMSYIMATLGGARDEIAVTDIVIYPEPS